ncbi:hypothetical protein GCM10022214_81470 [Actinomadura miaoliensis]|uniref:Uncharacterized protein n=1 Tax=Actinomadura miaoliensis TaxID=430685 RepID=A0ABP7X2M3_9ACTN
MRRSRFAEQPDVIVPRSLKQLLAEDVPEDTRRRRRRRHRPGKTTLLRRTT